MSHEVIFLSLIGLLLTALGFQLNWRLSSITSNQDKLWEQMDGVKSSIGKCVKTSDMEKRFDEARHHTELLMSPLRKLSNGNEFSDLQKRVTRLEIQSEEKETK